MILNAELMDAILILRRSIATGRDWTIFQSLRPAPVQATHYVQVCAGLFQYSPEDRHVAMSVAGLTFPQSQNRQRCFGYADQRLARERHFFEAIGIEPRQSNRCFRDNRL